ncbi:hypothetical protein [Nocardioides panaciterrulae]|uniref:Uncharacterized protein n=1 Tax=Nocardioides panaciterrulae TaxID=661492 RepID=A0A7Y9JA16_9ACTN|nr:hypothetical protein [Nocardioides panaciterrulae]NYD40928.1 hypothetical protein [Nocardioides panaciterrulae]
MSDLERRRTEAEARETAGRRSSADRARLWASLNKYLASEGRHAHRVAEEERAAGRDESDRRRD